MTKDNVLAWLEAQGDVRTKKIYLSHGAREPLFGVKNADLKELKKKVGIDHALAAELYETGNSDAMYFAGLIEDISAMTEKQLESWVGMAYWDMLAERCVAALASKTPFAPELARKWIRSGVEMTVCAGYALYNCLFMTVADGELDLDEAALLLTTIGEDIFSKSPRLQYAMNNTVIMAGIYAKRLHAHALEVACAIGRVDPVIAKNNCNSQSALEYLEKYAARGRIGIKIKNPGH